MKGGTLLILGCRVKGQGHLLPPARGCHALHCLVCFSIFVNIRFQSWISPTIFHSPLFFGSIKTLNLPLLPVPYMNNLPHQRPLHCVLVHFLRLDSPCHQIPTPKCFCYVSRLKTVAAILLAHINLHRYLQKLVYKRKTINSEKTADLFIQHYPYIIVQKNNLLFILSWLFLCHLRSIVAQTCRDHFVWSLSMCVSVFVTLSLQSLIGTCTNVAMFRTNTCIPWNAAILAFC